MDKIKEIKMKDYYDGKYYYISNKKYSEKQIMKYLSAIGFTEDESRYYLWELKCDYLKNRRK